MVNKHMDGTKILHIKKDNTLIGIMTPDIAGMDHIVYPAEITDETIQEVLRVRATIPQTATIEERVQATKEAFTKEGFEIEEVI